MTKKEMIIRTMCDFPNLNKWQIASRVGCHPTYVNQVENQWLKDLPKRDDAQVEMFPEVERVDVQDVNTTGIDAILAERGSRYGKFETHAEITQRLKMLATKFLHNQGKELEFDQQEALDMIFHKIGRIINGDPSYIDSWDDIAGYAKLVADRLRGDSK
jgi:hypothetical protein